MTLYQLKEKLVSGEIIGCNWLVCYVKECLLRELDEMSNEIYSFDC